MMFLDRYWLRGVLFLLAVALLSGCTTTGRGSVPVAEAVVVETVVEAVEETPAPVVVEEDEQEGEPEKLLIGREEPVTLVTQDLTYEARIDTGAALCSICALDIERFERDGKRWVRFKLPNPEHWSDDKVDDAIEMEMRLKRNVRIRQHGDNTQRRPTVKLLVKMGSIEERVEFTLVDRSEHDYAVLVGRNLLDGFAIVDVSKSHIVSP